MVDSTLVVIVVVGLEFSQSRPSWGLPSQVLSGPIVQQPRKNFVGVGLAAVSPIGACVLSSERGAMAVAPVALLGVGALVRSSGAEG